MRPSRVSATACLLLAALSQAPPLATAYDDQTHQAINEGGVDASSVDLPLRGSLDSSIVF